MTHTEVWVYSDDDGYKESSETSFISKPRKAKRFEITTDMYPSVNSMMDEITMNVPIAISYKVDENDITFQ